MGMFIIVILVGAFGFLVYHKFDLRQRQLLAEVKPNGSPVDDGGVEAANAHAASFDEFQPGEPQPDLLEPAPQGSDLFQPGDVLTAQSDSPSFDSDLPLEPAIADAAPFDPLSPDPLPLDPLPLEPLPFDDETPVEVADSTPPASPFDNLLEPLEGASDRPINPPTELPAETMVADTGLFPPFDSEPTAEPAPTPERVTDVPAFPPLEQGALNNAPATVDSGTAAAPFAQPNDRFPEQNSPTELVDQFQPAQPLPPVGDTHTASAATAGPPAFPPFDAGTTEQPPAVDNPFDDTITPQPPIDGPVDFMANVQPETLQPAAAPATTKPTAVPQIANPETRLPPADPFVNAAQTTIADSEPELLPIQQQPLPPLEPAGESPAIAQTGRLNPDTAIAMLDPAPDVNLFEEPISRSKPPVTDPEPDFPAAAEPEAPDFPGFEDSPRTFEPAPQLESFPTPDRSAETITPPETNLFSDPIDDPPPTGVITPPAAQRVPLPRDPIATEGERVFGTPGTNIQQYDPPPRYADDEDSFDVNAPGVGVAHIVPGASRIRLTAATQECAICEVQAKDNYWTISRRAYGTARYFSSLAEYNRHRIPDPRKLRPGMKVLVPDPKILEAKYPEFFKDQKKQEQRRLPSGFFLQKDGSPAYRVGARETLGEISQKHLGRASRWIQIFRMNQQILQDPNKLKPGTVIKLPDDATNVQLRP